MAGNPNTRWVRRIGPGIITAAVVLGPGSIVSASSVGAKFGYALIWLLVCTAIFMATFTAISARIGCVVKDSLLETIAQRYGRWLAVILGLCGWLVAAGFQVGNNLGVSTAMQGLVPALPVWLWPVVFTAASIAFLLGAKNLYRFLEWLMITLVGVMILAFAANLVHTGVDASQAARGLIPLIPGGNLVEASALFATTFSIVAAFAQAYLVKEKQWGIEEYRTGIRDAWLGIVILGAMTLTIMLCAAGAFYARAAGGDGEGVSGFTNAAQLAAQLKAVFGTGSLPVYVFCLGLAAASFSSFIANAMIGGFLLSDGLRLGCALDSPRVKAAASAALLVGMTVALLALRIKDSAVGSILIAQAATLLVSPLCGVFLLVVANSRAIMGEHRNRAAANVVAAIGLGVVLWMTWLTAKALPGKIAALLQ